MRDKNAMKETTELWSAQMFLRRLAAQTPARPQRILAAVSGGLDSMCLLDFLLEWCQGSGGTVIAAHFHHGLRGAAADRDAAFVRDWCARREVPYLLGWGDTRALAKQEGLSAEEAARRLRYGFLTRAAQQADCRWIATGHHADDNAETMLLNLCRGTGSRGLAGIPQVRGNVVRPFLDVSRAALERYAAARGLPHVEDETNADPEAAARNLLRQTVLPALRQINPRVIEHMNRTAGLLRQESAALDLAASALAKQAEEMPRGLRILRRALAQAPAAVGNRAALELMERACGQRRDLTEVDVDGVLALAKGPGTGRELRLAHRLTARADGEWLVLELRQKFPPPARAIHVGETVFYGRWQVALGRQRPADGMALSPELEGAALTVSAWEPADRMTLPGARGERSLKRLCADGGWTPTQRDGLPVLRAGGRPAAVPGVGVDMRFLPKEGEAPLYVQFRQKTEENDHEK